MAFNLKLIGNKELQRFFDGFEKKVQKKMVKKTMKPAFKVVLTHLRATYPKRTGLTRRKIKMVDLNFRPRPTPGTNPAGTSPNNETRPRRRRRRGTSMGVKIPMPTRAALGIPAGSKHYYPAVIEYGSRKRNIPAGGQFRKSVDHNASRVYTTYRQRLGALIDQEARR